MCVLVFVFLINKSLDVSFVIFVVFGHVGANFLLLGVGDETTWAVC